MLAHLQFSNSKMPSVGSLTAHKHPHGTMSHPSERSQQPVPQQASFHSVLEGYSAPPLRFHPPQQKRQKWHTTKRGLSLYYLQVVGIHGGGMSHSHTATSSVHVRTLARPHTLCTTSLAPGPGVLVQADARSRPPARPRLIYDPRVCFQGSANKDDLHQRNSRPAGWLAGRRRPDYWECARPPTEGHFENSEMTTDRETGSRYYFVNRIYLDCISILVSRSANEFLANVSSTFFSWNSKGNIYLFYFSLNLHWISTGQLEVAYNLPSYV